MSDDNAADRGEEITSNEKEFTSCEQNNTEAMAFKFEAPPTNSSSGLTFKPSTPSRGVFTFGQSSHPSNNKNDSGLSTMMSTLDVNDNNETNDESFNILDNMSICASCGKEGNSDDMNTCNKCQLVKYWNAACKIRHDEKLFKQPPPQEECPICMLSMPLDSNQVEFKSCCGQRICHGCIYEMKMSEGKDLCAFCRMPPPDTDEDKIKQLKKLMDNGNANAFNVLAFSHATGINNLPQDMIKANELYLKAGELGCANAYHNLGVSYHYGDGVDMDMRTAKHYYELAAMMGHTYARYTVGWLEGQAGNHHRAFKHMIIAARAGYTKALDPVEKGFMSGFISKDEYARTLRAYHERQKEMKSEARDTVAVAQSQGYVL